MIARGAFRCFMVILREHLRPECSCHVQVDLELDEKGQESEYDDRNLDSRHVFAPSSETDKPGQNSPGLKELPTCIPYLKQTTKSTKLLRKRKQSRFTCFLSNRSTERIRLATRRSVFLLCLQQMGFPERRVAEAYLPTCSLRKYPSVLRPESVVLRLQRVA